MRPNAVAAMIAVSMLAGGQAMAQMSEKGVTVQLEAQNSSGETGTATLTPEGNNTRVVIKMTPSKEAQPAHIHQGTCDKLNPKPLYPLANVQNGSSSTLVHAPLSKITAEATAINVHKSRQEAKVYVACGDIKG